jgi:peptidoglycan/xylan/chitin deacetylase (PgdA/CDA1 family)
MRRRLVFVLILSGFVVLVYGTFSSKPGYVESVLPVEARALPAPLVPPLLPTEELWAAAIAKDPWPNLATHGRTRTLGGEVALTFDDGPDPYTTPQVLDTLHKYNIEATFFVVGSSVRENPELVRRIVEEGHTLGNHTYTHTDMSELSPQQMRQELQRTQEAVDKALGYHYPMDLMRPPYGDPYFDSSSMLPVFKEVVREEQLFVVLWTLDTQDYLADGSPAMVIRKVISADRMVRPMADRVVLLHDNHRQTARALPEIIDYYQASSPQFTDVHELLADKYADR